MASSPIVRFAPSPTGLLHVGNVRTALINWLFAHGSNGKFILRIDDTDLERSTKEFEAQIRDDLKWLGLDIDDTFNQSARFEEYDTAANDLKARGLLYPCYETADELERKRKIALSAGRPPVYDRAALKLTNEEKAAYEAEGRKPHWRFKLSGERVTWTDLVRSEQSIDTASISDPVLIRADGSYLYTLPSVVDDIEYDITHIVRGEDHVTNSGAQIEIVKALGGKIPAMAHTPLLVGADGQGLSKRLGSLSIKELRENQGMEPMAINSLLSLIGTSDAVEVKDNLSTLAENFEFSKISRASARFDEAELNNLNASIIHNMPYEEAKPRIEPIMKSFSNAEVTHEIWDTVKANCIRLRDVELWLEIIFASAENISDPEDSDYISEAAKLLPDTFTELTWKEWTDALKTQTGRKGKALFMPLRKALTGQSHGPDMSKMLLFIGPEKAKERLNG